MILTSSDLQSWSKQLSGTINDLYSISFGNGKYVAVGDSGIVIYSTDGVNWKKSNPVLTSWFLNSVFFYNNQFIAAGPYLSLTSPDGVNWTNRSTSASRQVYQMIYAKGIYLKADDLGDLYSSYDGIQWDIQTIHNIFALTCSGNQILAFASTGDLFVSTDGLSWSAAKSGLPLFSYAVCYGNSLLVAVGSSGKILSVSTGELSTKKVMGNKEMNSISILSTYPYLHINLNSSRQAQYRSLSIFDLSGKLISTTSIQGNRKSVVISTLCLSSGVYTIKAIALNNTKLIKPFIISR
jgi:hypothetical protein